MKDDFIIRLRKPLREADVEALNDEFGVLVKEGSKIVQCGAYEVETDHLELPRLAFAHTRYRFGLIRKLIDRINELDPAE